MRVQMTVTTKSGTEYVSQTNETTSAQFAEAVQFTKDLCFADNGQITLNSDDNGSVIVIPFNAVEAVEYLVMS